MHSKYDAIMYAVLNNIKVNLLDNDSLHLKA